MKKLFTLVLATTMCFPALSAQLVTKSKMFADESTMKPGVLLTEDTVANKKKLTKMKRSKTLKKKQRQKRLVLRKQRLKRKKILQEKIASQTAWQLRPMIGVSAFTIDGAIDGPSEMSGNFEYSNGMTAGVLVDYGRSNIVLETGILFLQTGGRRQIDEFSFTGLNEDYEELRRLDYVGIPLVAKYHMSNFREHSTVYFKLGAMPAVLSSARTEELRPSGRVVRNDKNVYHETDLLGILGFGGHIVITKGASLVIDGTYMRGLRPLDNEQSFRGYNHGFSTSAAISFAL